MLSGSTEHLGMLGHCHQEGLPESLWKTKEEWVLGRSYSTVQVKVWEREAGRMSLGCERPEVCPVCFLSLGQAVVESNTATGGKARPGGEGKDRGGGQAGRCGSLPGNYPEAGLRASKATALLPQCGW